MPANPRELIALASTCLGMAFRSIRRQSRNRRMIYGFKPNHISVINFYDDFSLNGRAVAPVHIVLL